MTQPMNIFLFRHCNYRSDGKLTKRGIQQAESAGKIVGKILSERNLEIRRQESGFEELEGITGIHSNHYRTKQTLDLIIDAAGRNFDGGALGYYGRKVQIESGRLIDNLLGCSEILNLIEGCDKLGTGIQIIVGHEPVIAKVTKSYVNEGFKFEGDKMFLHTTPNGVGYHIYVPEKRITLINQSL